MASTEKHKESSRKYYHSHKEHRKEMHRKYYQEHKERIHELKKQWNQKHSAKMTEEDRANVAKRVREYAAENKEKWMMFLSNIGYLQCSRCGYNRCFSALEFHHVDPSIKEYKVSEFWQKPIADWRIAEIKKTIPLCSNCHKELHAGYWEYKP